ncbi:MAG: class I SAM-dependent methyltransferase [Candidatus Aenigmarchaeota archaeon]|nr:class I SAM-dependent methyltransferase [Candidatus Aenigmarchaeota archaeon]
MIRNTDLLRRAGKIEGMLTDREMLLLRSLAKNGPGKGAIVEIGSYKGKSTACLALGTKEAKREKVFAVDWHKGWKNAVKGGTFGEFSENMKKLGVEDYVMPVVMKSEDAAVIWRKKNAPIRLLWIDGSHDYKDVRKDFVLWNRFLVEGGIVAFHDSFWEGPYRVVNEYLLKSGRFSCAGMVDYIAFAVKSKADAKERNRNRRMLLLRSLLKYPMRAEHLHPAFINRIIKNRLLSGFRSEKF